MYDAGGRELRTHLHSCTAFSLFLQPQTRTKAALGGSLLHYCYYTLTKRRAKRTQVGSRDAEGLIRTRPLRGLRSKTGKWMWRDLLPAHLVVLDAALGELVDVEPEGAAEAADALALLRLEELKRHGQKSGSPASTAPPAAGI